MASSDDYIGMTFGNFLVENLLGSGKEAEVFQVLNQATGRRYAMRLDGNDDRIWEGQPIHPPLNLSVEAKNIRGSWHATILYEKDTPRDSKWKFNVPRIFGVKDLRYLIVVSSPFNLRGSLSFEQFLTIAPADDIYRFLAWEEVVLAMLGDAHSANKGSLSETEWLKKWDILLGGEILRNAMSQYMMGGHLDALSRTAILARIGQTTKPGSELAFNLLLRLCGAVSRGRISLEAAKQTAADQFFRENLTLREFEQIVACWNVLISVEPQPSETLLILEEIFAVLSKQPVYHCDHPKEFEQSIDDEFENFIEKHRLNRFSLFLQEHASLRQDFITMESQR